MPTDTRTPPRPPVPPAPTVADLQARAKDPAFRERYGLDSVTLWVRLPVHGTTPDGAFIGGLRESTPAEVLAHHAVAELLRHAEYIIALVEGGLLCADNPCDVCGEVRAAIAAYRAQFKKE